MTENERFLVVRNDEEQYSLWWSGRDLPAGWHAAGVEGTREECLAHIGEVWTDMRPLSLRRRMAAAASGAADGAASGAPAEAGSGSPA
ncbi:MbtH family protein [Actinomadura violacea]|uniref:MbtH family NRPS accessory protein n=1 Tax=Actinomadura violacea TaxID=2819934 RepID=A0ABS3RNH9_9ACTN|nr:MbtH family NRPS accessory protein [Actinomadura violacea]MBO2458315.1 MbtH family NRPS accessory protein [Actinomadura violacea]